ncbi:hypothetical protein [Bacillus norwichensis]|uniref:Uncharacterized protein n=1 Tax=Bacillus norwichensis TaxID=2762217 RepID=A0ABR8VP44_9BACI|nr:hypothetical protein [Bacillus norwichensis]MBD8006540.1 hypothetical protein [Bacillus norwichensis]
MQNKVASLLMIIGCFEIFIGLLIGFKMAYDFYFEWPVFLLWAGIGTLSGIFVIGFAQVIELLHKINEKLGTEENTKDTDGDQE